MSISPTVLGLAVGIMMGAMDFSLAKSITSLIRPSNIHAAQAIIMGGFVVRLGLIGIVLWTLSRTSAVNFLAVCVGLTGTFTLFTLGQAVRSFVGAGRQHKQVPNRR